MRNTSLDELFANHGRRPQQRSHGSSTSALSDDGDLLRVATKLRDVLSHPSQSSDLVGDPKVALDLRARDGQEAQSGEAIVELHTHDILSRSQIASIKAAEGSAVASSKATAVDAHQDRPQISLGAGFGDVRRLDVHVEAVLCAAVVVFLRAVRAKCGCSDDLAFLAVYSRIFEAACVRVSMSAVQVLENNVLFILIVISDRDFIDSHTHRVRKRDPVEAERLLISESNIRVAGRLDSYFVGRGRDGVAGVVLVAGLSAENRKLAVRLGVG